MVRDRTTASSSFLPVLVLSVVLVAPLAGDARSEPAQIFPSQPIWTISFSETPVATPAIAGERIFIPLQSAISARSLRDNGNELWRATHVADGPIAATVDRVLVPSTGALIALDAATGSEVWRIPTAPLTAPIVTHGALVFVAAKEMLSAYTLADGTLAWTSKPIGPIEQRSTASENWVYVPVADGRIVALDMSTGAQIWETSKIGIKPAEPLVAGDRLFAGSEAKQFCSFRLTDPDDNPWCFAVGAPIVGRPAVDARRVYFVALDNQIWAHDLRNGARQWKADLKYRPSAGPTVIGETVTAPGRTKKLVAFDVTSGQPAGPELAVDEYIVAPVVFVPASEGVPVRAAVLFGELTKDWKLMLAGPPPPVLPSIKVEPLTTLPGRVVRRVDAPVPRE